MTELRSIPSIPTKILLPIDFSQSSQNALEIASDLALHFGAKLFLVNVIPFFPTTTMPDFVPEVSFVEAARNVAEKRLERCHSILVKKGIMATTSVEVGNDVSGNIMEVIDREEVDMVIISTHGISGWHPLIFGSIAEKVVKLVQCPLLLLRSTKTEPDQETLADRLKEWW